MQRRIQKDSASQIVLQPRYADDPSYRRPILEGVHAPGLV
jgi:hypothetical protein